MVCCVPAGLNLAQAGRTAENRGPGPPYCTKRRWKPIQSRALHAPVAPMFGASALASGFAGSEWRPDKIRDLATMEGADDFVGFETGDGRAD